MFDSSVILYYPLLFYPNLPTSNTCGRQKYSFFDYRSAIRLIFPLIYDLGGLYLPLPLYLGLCLIMVLGCY